MGKVVDQGPCDLGSGLGLSLLSSVTLGKSLNHSGLINLFANL